MCWEKRFKLLKGEWLRFYPPPLYILVTNISAIPDPLSNFPKILTKNCSNKYFVPEGQMSFNHKNFMKLLFELNFLFLYKIKMYFLVLYSSNSESECLNIRNQYFSKKKPCTKYFCLWIRCPATDYCRVDKGKSRRPINRDGTVPCFWQNFITVCWHHILSFAAQLLAIIFGIPYGVLRVSFKKTSSERQYKNSKTCTNP